MKAAAVFIASSLSVCQALGLSERHRRGLHIGKDLLEESERRVDELLLSPYGLGLTQPSPAEEGLSTLKLSDRLQSDAADVAELADAAAKPPPAVQQELKRREKEAEKLESEADALRAEGQGLEEAHLETVSRLVDGTSLMRQIMRTRQQIKNLQGKMDAMHQDAAHLQEKHDMLVKKLDNAMQPRLKASADRVATQEARLKTAHGRLEKWEQKLAEYKKEALSHLEKRKGTKKALKDLEESIQRMEKERDALIKEYEDIKAETSNSVGAYHYVETHFQAMQGKAKILEKRVDQQEKSYDRLNNVYQTESQQLDKSLIASELRLSKKFESVKAKYAQENQTLAQLTANYREWQAEQKRHAEEVAQRHAAYEASWRDHANRRYGMMRSAQDEAGRQAESASQWSGDDWADEDGLAGFDMDDDVDGSDTIDAG
eukprot:CAMPEP_0178426316 /NCGR_PEP_ID=MMETSP0689_2-20121128/29173_1 /TAXON_ID=160604 /ORGANISM="Amphidinium massartii, Strain CS-259" /LENGTH=430 /DNA_ID=CAMNT_0020048001 /DNA_START=1 /DNA_END=1290 /DNA_ORIENTATION=+